MTEQPFPHGGVIQLPESMPPSVAESLSATLTQVWQEYLSGGGNPQHAEEFWEFAVSGSRTWEVYAVGVGGTRYRYTVKAPSRFSALEKAYVSHSARLRSGEVGEPLGSQAVALHVDTPAGGDAR